MVCETTMYPATEMRERARFNALIEVYRMVLRSKPLVTVAGEVPHAEFGLSTVHDVVTVVTVVGLNRLNLFRSILCLRIRRRTTVVRHYCNYAD